MQDHIQEANIQRSGSVEFRILEPPNIASSSPVVIQALDNQWMPRSLLRRAMKQRWLSRRVMVSLKRLVRAEYLRALLNQRQVIINRAYLYNNQCIFQDYLRPGRNREAFKALLDEGTVIPYLYTESSPLEPPPFEVDNRGFTSWQQICQEVRMHCLRLSWDDTSNRKIAQAQLARRFHNFAQNIASGDYEQYIHDLNLDVSARDGLRNLLLDLARMCLTSLEQEKLLARSDLYKAYITGGESPAERHYSSTRSFSAELKQLIDLAYNIYLADALGGYLLTPADSLQRTALQEWEQLAHLPVITGDELMRIIQETSFPTSGSSSLTWLGSLSLQDVQVARRTDEWRLYIKGLDELLTNPFQSPWEAVTKVYRTYLTFVARITKLMQGHHPERAAVFIDSWIPVVELIIDIAGAVLSIIWTLEGPVYRFSGRVSSLVGSAVAPVVVRLIIKDASRAGMQVDVTTSIDFLRCKMQYARQQWTEIQQRVRMLPGFRAESVSSGTNGPTINYRRQTP